MGKLYREVSNPEVFPSIIIKNTQWLSPHIGKGLKYTVLLKLTRSSETINTYFILNNILFLLTYIAYLQYMLIEYQKYDVGKFVE